MSNIYFKALVRLNWILGEAMAKQQQADVEPLANSCWGVGGACHHKQIGYKHFYSTSALEGWWWCINMCLFLLHK